MHSQSMTLISDEGMLIECESHVNNAMTSNDAQYMTDCLLMHDLVVSP